ncbi:MAG: hypothetical protein KY455_03655 [Euryarchaeota archaeon]|nr:hypothetical protein [Euryarchaeota archaeon]
MACPFCHERVVPALNPLGRLRCPLCLNTGDRSVSEEERAVGDEEESWSA